MNQWIKDHIHGASNSFSEKVFLHSTFFAWNFFTWIFLTSWFFLFIFTHIFFFGFFLALLITSSTSIILLSRFFSRMSSLNDSASGWSTKFSFGNQLDNGPGVCLAWSLGKGTKIWTTVNNIRFNEAKANVFLLKIVCTVWRKPGGSSEKPRRPSNLNWRSSMAGWPP